MQSHDQAVKGKIGKAWEVYQVFGFDFVTSTTCKRDEVGGGRSSLWGVRGGELCSSIPNAKASEATQ